MRISDWSSDVCSSDLLVDRWDAQRLADPDKTRIILTHTNAEVRDLNQAARDRLRDAGELGTDVRVSAERGAREFAGGDRIMFLKNERGLGVKNGTLGQRSEEHTSELQSLMRISYAVFCLKKKKTTQCTQNVLHTHAKTHMR